MDGNFSAEHMHYKAGVIDIPLSAGMAFMENLDTYKAHLKSGKESIQVCWPSHYHLNHCYPLLI
jgi:hypothetical protein